MKKIFYYAAMALAVSAVMVSCEKKNEDTPEPSKKVRLATPEVTATVDAENGVVTVEWGKVENAVSYEYKVDAGTETPSTELSFTLNVADLKAGDHTVEVKAIPAEDSEEYNESNWGSASFTIEENTEPVEPSEDLKEWLGTYTVTATRQVELYQGAEYIEMKMVEDPMNFEITIEPSTDPNYVFVYGLSVADPQVPAVAAIFSDSETKEPVGLGLFVETQPIAEDQDGNEIAFYPIFEGVDKYVGIVTGCPYSFIFINDGSSIKSVAYKGSFDEEQTDTFTVVATDIMSTSGGSIWLYYDSFPQRLPAGEFTLVKGGSGVSAHNAANFNAFSGRVFGEIPSFSVVK